MSKKRGNGEGSISFHKASNRYIAQYTKPMGNVAQYMVRQEKMQERN